MHTYQWKNAATHFLHFHRLCVKDLCSLCQWIFDIHRGHACLEFKGMLDSQGPVTKPDWQGVLQCSQPWEHAVIHSLHLFITRTQGVGAYPTMHCAKRKHSSLVAIHHWAHSSFCCTWIWTSLDCLTETWAPSEKSEALHRVDRAKELETSCCASTVLTTESLCHFTRTTYQCHCVKTE